MPAGLSIATKLSSSYKIVSGISSASARNGAAAAGETATRSPERTVYEGFCSRASTNTRAARIHS